MKIGIWFGMFLIVSFVHSANLPWTWQNPLPEGNEYTDVCVINENIIFVVEEEAGTILKTTNGGLAWDVSFTPYPDSQPGYYELYGIDFPDSLTGYAVGNFWGSNWNTTYHAVILKTTNQGATWTFQYLGAQGTWLYDVDFPQGNNQIGYAVGRNGMILKTTNGGQSWVQQNSGTTYELLAVHFPVDANTGYVVGGNRTTTPVILKTTNGGSNWNSQTSPANVTYWDVCFIDNQNGYAGGYTLGSGGNGTIIKTTNGGSTWQQIWYQQYREIYSVHFLNAQVGYAGGWAHSNSGWSGSFIMKTTNEGSSWTPVFLPKFMTYVLPIGFANTQTGYAAGYVYDQNGGHGQLLKTTDAGTSWIFLNTGPEGIFWAVDFPESDQIGYAVGDAGYIYKTTDGGATWVQQTTGTGQVFYDVDFLDNQLGFAVGANGTFFKTTNGGNVWTPKNANTTATLYAVKFINSQIGYIAGLGSTGGVIMKSTDGGDNWISQTIPNNNTYRAIQDLFFFNADTGYAVAGATPSYGGAVGLVYKTTNGGQTWVENYAPSSANFYAIDFPENSQVGYISGLMGGTGTYKMIKTTNGGNSWTGQSLGGGIVPAVGVSFADNLIGYAVFRPGGYHMMMKTTNGGSNWFAINSLTWHGYEDIQAINANVVYAVGRGGMIRKTTNGGSVWIEEEKGDGDIKVDNHYQSLWVYPNPFRNNVHIRCRMHDTGYMIKIYDVSGRVVKSFNLESCILNHESSITWFGDDKLGRELPAGVYFIVPEDKSSSPVRVVKIR
ncbi:MAG: YCF48-related protein [candidate division WOR-3 bacterium]